MVIESRAAEIIAYWHEVEHRKSTRWVDYVYFIQAIDGGPVKIGSAHDPRGRLSELQCGNPRPLCIRHVILCGWRTEAQLHEFWTDPKWLKQARVRGEWFGHGQEGEILAMGARIAELQIQSFEAGDSLEDVRTRIVRRGMFQRPDTEAAA